MKTKTDFLEKLLLAELNQLSDQRVLQHIQEFLVTPSLAIAQWGYGSENFQCYLVGLHPKSETAILFCQDFKFPEAPWQLVKVREGNETFMLGNQASWYGKFLDAYFESLASTEIPIWRVFKSVPGGDSVAITAEDDWDETWKKVTELRKLDPDSRYACNHSVSY